MEDVDAVMEAVGAERAVIFGSHEGCLMATLFAATYPERTTALALFHPSEKQLAAEYEVDDNELRALRERWGTQEFCDELLEDTCPTLYASEEARLWFANWLRVGASPAMGYELNRAFAETDLHDVYGAVRVPALVLYREFPIAAEESRAVAELIPDARLTRVSGSDYWGVFLSGEEIADELERLAAGEEGPMVPESVLTTVLFTDIVGSSSRAAELGDSAWRELLSRHHSVVRRELTRFRGEERDTAGDGFFATFDGPARAVRCAQAAMEAVRPLGLEVRAGVHTGECELHEKKVAGLAVAIGARVCAEAGASEVLVSRTVKDIVAGSGLEFQPRGCRELRGVGDWELFAVA